MLGPRLSLALVLLGLSGSAVGEEPAADPDWGEIEEIVVLGVRPGRLEPVPGASTDVIFTDTYRGESKDLAELLSEVQGIHVRRFGAAGDRSEVSIRGSSPSQVVVTLDGVRTNSVLTGGVDLSRICLPLLDRVQVVRGAGSTQEGSGAIGGVVNLVTRGAKPGRETRASVSGGAFDTYEGHLLHSGWWGDLDYSAGYCGFTTEGDFEFARPTTTIDGVEASYEPDSATRLNNDRFQHAGTLALGHPVAGGDLRLSDYGFYSEGGEPGTDSDDGATAGQALEARSRDFANLAQLRWEGELPALGSELELALHHRYESTDFRDPVSTPLTAPIDVEARLQTAGARLANEWRGALGSARNALDLQLDFAHDRLRADDQPGRDRSRAAGALRDTLQLWGELAQLSLGGRVDWSDGFDAELLPAVGLVVAPLRWLRLRGQASRAYRVPNFDELYHPDEGFIRGNPDLEPEDAWNFDAGVELRFEQLGPFSDLSLSAAVFRREVDEAIVWVLVNQRTLAPINTGAATSEGYELSASLDLTRYLRLSGNYTQLDSRRDRNGGRLPGEPREQSFARLRLGPERAWKLVGELEHVGEILVSENGGGVLPERTVVNARAALNLAALPGLGLGAYVSELWIYGALENIDDRAVRDTFSFPQPGRNGTLGIEGRW